MSYRLTDHESEGLVSRREWNLWLEIELAWRFETGLVPGSRDICKLVEDVATMVEADAIDHCQRSGVRELFQSQRVVERPNHGRT